MERRCPGCGALIQDNIKVCGNCGRIIPPKKVPRENEQHSVSHNSSQPMQKQTVNRNVNAQRKNSRQGYVHQKPLQQKSSANRNAQRNSFQQKNPKRQVPNRRLGSRKKTGLIDRFNLKKWLKLAVIVLVIYFIISLIQIFRVKHSTYDFKSTNMKMSQDNYGEAINDFFDSGSWSYNLFTCRVKYSGETIEGDEYKLNFSALGSIEVKGIEVDGEKKDKEQFETIIMGMFI